MSEFDKEEQVESYQIKSDGIVASDQPAQIYLIRIYQTYLPEQASCVKMLVVSESDNLIIRSIRI